MKKILLSLLVFTGFIFVNQISASELIKQELSISVEQAVKALEKDLKSRGLTVFATINHMKAAKKVDLTMKPAVLVIFGNPKVGTMLMNANMAWSYELPLKIAVYEDSTGKVWAQTRLLPTDIPAPEQEKRIAAMNNLLSKLVQIK